MAERLGTVFVELEIDDSKFTRSERKILDEARSTALSVEKNWRIIGEKSDLMYTAMEHRAVNAYNAIANNAKSSAAEQIRAQAQMVSQINNLNMQMARNPLYETLGVRSQAAIEAQKAAVISSYNTIKASGAATAQDLVNIERAKNERLKELNKEMAGEHEMNMAAMTRAVLRFYAAYYVASSAIRVVIDQLKSGFEAIDKFRISILSIAAQASVNAAGQDMAENFREAKAYAEGLVPVLMKADASSLATFENLLQMTTAMGNYGVFLDANNKKQIEAFTSLSNLISIMTQGPNQEYQFFQEMTALMTGQVNQASRIAKQIDAMAKSSGEYRDGIKDIVKLGKEHGDTLERYMPYLKGVNEATKEIGNTWSAVTSSFNTAWTTLQREVFKDFYTDAVTYGNKLNEYLKKNSEDIANNINNTVTAFKILGKTSLAIVSALTFHFGTAKDLIVSAGKDISTIFSGIIDDMEKWFKHLVQTNSLLSRIFNEYSATTKNPLNISAYGTNSTDWERRAGIPTPTSIPEQNPTTTNPFETLGIKTAAEYDRMRDAAISAYNDIKKSAYSTAADIIAAEEAKNKRLKEIDEQQYAGAKERARQATEEQRKALAEQKRIEDQLWKEAVKQANELRQIKEISPADDVTIAKLKLEQDKRNAADAAQAYRSMYKDLRGYEKEYYDFELEAIEEQKNAFYVMITKGKADAEELAKARVITNAWAANEIEKRNREFVRSTGNLISTMSASWDQFYDDQLNISRTMYDGWSEINNAILDDGTQVLKEGLKGNFDDIGDAWDNLMYHMKDIFFETVARIAMQKIMLNFGSPVLNGVTSAVTGATGSFLSSTGLSALFGSVPTVGVAGQNSTFWEAGAASSGLGSLVAPLAGIAAGMYGMYDLQKQFNTDDSWKNVLKTFAANPIQGSVNAVLKALGLSGGGKKAEWYGLTVHDITDEGVIMSSKARKGSSYDYAPGTSNVYELTASTAALKEYYAVLETYPAWVMDKEKEQLRSTLMEQYNYIEGKTKWYEDLKKNVDAALAQSLTEGLEEYESQINAYYSNLGEQAGSMFASAMGTAMQSGSFNTFFDAFKQQMLSVYQDTIVSGFTASPAYQNIMGPFLDALNQQIDTATIEGVFSPERFQQSITPILNQTLQKLEDMVPAFKAIYDALGGIDAALSGGAAAQIESIFYNIDRYIDGLTAAASPLDAEIKQITDTFEPWLQQLYALGASGAQVSDATADMMDAIDQVTQAYRESAQDMINDFVDSMRISDLAPTVSKEAYDIEFQKLYGLAQTGDQQAIQDLLSYVQGEYLPFYKGYAGNEYDYNEFYQGLFGPSGLLSNMKVPAPVVNIDTRGIGEAVATALQPYLDKGGTFTFDLKISEQAFATATVKVLRTNSDARTEIQLIG
jgi:hypothetical protein